MTQTSMILLLTVSLVVLAPSVDLAYSQGKSARGKDADLTFPPALSNGKQRLSVTSPRFLQRPNTLKADMRVAKTAPQVDFIYYPGQDYLGKPWSNWGDSLCAGGKYYSAIGDHLSVNAKGVGKHGVGTARVFVYDPADHTLQQLSDTATLLNRPKGHYAPGKIHTRLDLGADGWLYYATHRGSVRATTDAYHYQGDWVLRTNPVSRKTEIAVHAPVPHHAIPASVLDPERLIFYGSTAPAADREKEGIRFFAYDVKNRKRLYECEDGPARYLMLAKSTGCVYFVPGKDEGELRRFDPAAPNKTTRVKGSHIGVRAATQETKNQKIYTVSLGQRSSDAAIWEFDTKTEQTRRLGSAAVGGQAYVASLDVDPSGRFLYYTVGAHGGSAKDGTPIVQFEIATGIKKVIAFLEPYFTETHGLTLKGSYGSALSESGDKLYVTWNVSRGSRAWDCCGLTVIHIPSDER